MLRAVPAHSPGRQEGSSEPLLGGGWMGGALSLLLRTLLNVTLTVNNLVISYAAAGSVAALRCESLCVQTAAEDWWEQVEVGAPACLLMNMYINISLQWTVLHVAVHMAAAVYAESFTWENLYAEN